MNFRNIWFIFIIILLSCSGKNELVEISINSNTLLVEIANDDETRSLGLMNRDSLKEESGMIFVFEQERAVTFWMKNTLIPLSIAYIDKKGEILEIYDMVPLSEERISSKRSSIKYALEVNQGCFKRNNINIGDMISLDPIVNYSKSSK